MDFYVDGVSLLQLLVNISDGSDDFMGCIVRGYPEQNARAARRLLAVDAPDTATGRVQLYICPECGDIGLGGYSVRVAKLADTYVWEDFAYENDYSEAKSVVGVGPFSFDGEGYEQVIRSAGAL